MFFNLLTTSKSSSLQAYKSGISVWTFCHDREMNAFFAVGGEDLKVTRY